MDTTTYEDSFVSAWSKAKFPGANRAFVKSFCDEFGIAGFEYKPLSYSYIAATRRDGTGELCIHWGCTTGFTEAEARHFGAGADEVRISSTRKSTWLVSHPVTNSIGDSVSVINLATNTVSATIGVGSLPYGVAVNPAGTFAYVTNSNSNSVSVIAL
jgi:YVTN family beta-propeller protein